MERTRRYRAWPMDVKPIDLAVLLRHLRGRASRSIPGIHPPVRQGDSARADLVPTEAIVSDAEVGKLVVAIGRHRWAGWRDRTQETRSPGRRGTNGYIRGSGLERYRGSDIAVAIMRPMPALLMGPRSAWTRRRRR